MVDTLHSHYPLKRTSKAKTPQIYVAADITPLGVPEARSISGEFVILSIKLQGIVQWKDIFHQYQEG